MGSDLMCNESDWPRVPLGNITIESTARLGSDAAAGLRVYGVSRQSGLTPEAKYVGKDLSRYKRLSQGMFAYNPMRLNIGSIGISGLCLGYVFAQLLNLRAIFLKTGHSETSPSER